MRLISGGVTDVGRKRSHNEDAFFASDKYGSYVVADGMGGHAAGELASTTAINAISEFVDRFRLDPSITWPYGFDKRLNAESNAMITGIRMGNIAIYDMQNDNPDLRGMGTTIASVQFSEDMWATIAHVGDSRVYRLRQRVLEQCTRDHSWVNEQIARKLISEEEAKTHRFRNVITRALGYKTDMAIDVKIEQVETGDIYLLCSDGLSGMVDDAKLAETLIEVTDPQNCAQTLVNLANQAGGIDNITAIVVRIDN